MAKRTTISPYTEARLFRDRSTRDTTWGQALKVWLYTLASRSWRKDDSKRVRVDISFSINIKVDLVAVLLMGLIAYHIGTWRSYVPLTIQTDEEVILQQREITTSPHLR